METEWQFYVQLIDVLCSTPPMFNSSYVQLIDVLCSTPPPSLKVWLSKDRSQVSILWDCFPSQASQCSADLKRLQGRLRSCLADRLDMKKVPSLVFIRDKLLPAQARAAAVLDRVARESGGKDPPMTKASGLPEDAGLRADGGGNQGGDRRGAGASDWRHVALGSASKGQDDRRPLSSAASVQQARVDAAVDAIRSRMRAQPNKRSDISAPVAD